MNVTSSLTSVPRAVPEILAPVGGRDQFFAALNSGADAVFLGLKNFNARARAENFTLEDLRELVPLAHQHDMRVLITMNILIKNSELPNLIETLSALEDIGVDALIVQDVGLARLCKQFFPQLRLHASTQLAVHNLDGVREAMKLGFKRVVLARELTALEIKKIRAAIPRDEVELEAFCHGSLCYSYSGLCFFSGAEDARSGNRGECAYTCRKPYKILNEPGHGFLFSMKDLNTLESLDLLVDAGVDTLKIEGRKKDAQYVTGVVQAYRQKLDQIFEKPTLRTRAPAGAHGLTRENTSQGKDLSEQLSLTFQRNGTSFFLKGRYHENVIDLDNPTHKGQRVGTILAVRGRKIELISDCALERFDGLRIDPQNQLFHSTPQHGAQTLTSVDGVKSKYENKVSQFSLRNMWSKGIQAATILAGSTIEIEIPDELPIPHVGDHVYRTRSDAMRRTVEKQIRPPSEHRLRAVTEINLNFVLTSSNESLQLQVTASKFGKKLTSCSLTVPALRPKNETSSLKSDLEGLFNLLGNIGFASTKTEFEGDDHWFVPKGQLKELKRQLEAALPQAHQSFMEERLAAALEHVQAKTHKRSSENSSTAKVQGSSELAIKVDRLEYLPWLSEFITQNQIDHSTLALRELVFEFKRAFLPELDFAHIIGELKKFQTDTGLAIRIAFPTVLRAWDEPLMKRWLQECFAAGLTSIEAGNISHFSMLEKWGLKETLNDISTDFTLYSLNQEAAAQWTSHGATTIALSIEDDSTNVRAVLAGFPENAQPQAILYKDTPLFIAESCSLTALHNGCPTNKVCGYRTLEIQNDAGDIFYVAHESCKSIVYAKQPYSVTQHRATFEAAGVRKFRVDFLTRPYDQANIEKILASVFQQSALKDSHAANFNRTLL